MHAGFDPNKIAAGFAGGQKFAKPCKRSFK